MDMCFDSKKLTDMIEGLKTLSRRAKNEEEFKEEKIPKFPQILNSPFAPNIRFRSYADEEDLLIDKIADVVQNDIIKPPNVLKSVLFPDGRLKYDGEEFQVEETVKSIIGSKEVDPEKLGSQIFAGMVTVFERQAKKKDENQQNEEPNEEKSETNSNVTPSKKREKPFTASFKLVTPSQPYLNQNQNTKKVIVEFMDPNINPRSILKTNKTKFILKKIETNFSF